VITEWKQEADPPRSGDQQISNQPGELDLTERTRQFLLNVSGFLDSKRVLDSTAEAVLPHKWMEQHPSFVDKELMVQKNLNGEQVKSLDELLVVAKLAKPKFDVVLTKIVRDSGLDPSQVVTTRDGKPVMLDHHCL